MGNLKELYMDSNEIRLAGGFAIVDAALNKDNLEKLTLDTNQFGAEGCGRIMKKLKDAGKNHLMEDIEDDEDPEDSEDEEGADDDDGDGEDGDEEPEGEEPIKENVTSLSSFSFGGGSAPPVASSIFGGGPPSVTSSTDPADKKAVEAPKSIFGGLNLAPHQTVCLVVLQLHLQQLPHCLEVLQRQPLLLHQAFLDRLLPLIAAPLRLFLVLLQPFLEANPQKLPRQIYLLLLPTTNYQL